MSILTYPLGFIGGGKEFYNNVMENSLRFNDDDSAELSRTNAESDRFSWTYSFWLKGMFKSGSPSGPPAPNLPPLIFFKNDLI